VSSALRQAALHLRDAARAYANEVRARHGVPFAVRMGLNSGEVVVGRIGDDLRMEFTAQGHTVGLAQRMEALAESGHICVSEHTARLVEGYFTLQDLGRTQVKGAAAKVTVAGWSPANRSTAAPARCRWCQSRAAA
jgi:class 3 adenylate cyclase